MCIRDSILGWLAFILGLFMKRLSGLEAIFVIQYAWFTIFMMRKGLSLAFQQTWPLKYSTGYNYPIEVGYKYGRVSEFKIDFSYFYSNMNACLLFQLVSLFMVIVSYIRFYRFLKLKDVTEKELNLR